MVEKWQTPVAVLPASILAGLVIACWIARAPTSFTGKIPFVGENSPIELTAIIFIVVGPIIGFLMTGAVWVLIANGWGSDPAAIILKSRSNENILLTTLFVLIVAAETFLSLQYFLILAPEHLCSSRPHFDFLWTTFPGDEKITHCMSQTRAINENPPYYLRGLWQLAQAWGHIAWPLLSLACLVGAWFAWKGTEGTSLP